MTPEKAKENLQRLTDQLQAHVKASRPHETVASRELLLWLIDAARKTLDKKAPVSLERSLGLVQNGQGNKKQKKTKHLQLAMRAAAMRWPDDPPSWKQIAKELSYQTKSPHAGKRLQRIVESYEAEIQAALNRAVEP